MAKMWPNSAITYPFSGVLSGYVIHPYHVSDLYDELSGVETYIGFNPLNGFASITARISGIESGYWNISQDSVRAPLVIVNNGGTSILSGKFASALESGFLSAVDWTSFNSRVFRAGDTITGGLTVLDNLSGLRLFDSGIRPVGFIVNLGTVNSVIGSKSDNVYSIKGILAGSGNVGITNNANDIIISVTGVMQNLSFNAPLVLANSIVSGKFASATESGFLTNSDWNTFNNKQAAFTIANVGNGSGLFLDTIGTSFRFKSLIAGTNITFAVTTGDITVNSTATGGGIDYFTGIMSGYTYFSQSGVYDIGSGNAPARTIYSNQYATSLVSGNPGGAATALSINWNLGSVQKFNFNPGTSGNVYLTLSNPIPGSAYVLSTIQNPSGTTNIYFPSNVKWQGGVSGTMTSSGNAIDIFSLLYDGSNYYGNAGNNYK